MNKEITTHLHAVWKLHKLGYVVIPKPFMDIKMFEVKKLAADISIGVLFNTDSLIRLAKRKEEEANYKAGQK